MKALVYENYAENDDFESILQIKGRSGANTKTKRCNFSRKGCGIKL